VNLQTSELVSFSSLGIAFASGFGVWQGWFEYINANAPGLGVLSSLFFGIIGIVFLWLSLKKERLSNENKVKIDKQSIKIKGMQEKIDRLSSKQTKENAMPGHTPKEKAKNKSSHNKKTTKIIRKPMKKKVTKKIK